MLYICVILILSVGHNLLENVKSSRNVAIDMSDESIGDLVFHLQPEQKRIVRSIERTQKQYINCKYAVIFNTKCLQEGLLPKYTHIKLHDRAVKREEFTYEFRRKLVEEQLTRKQISLRKLHDKLNELSHEYARVIHEPDVRAPIDVALHEEDIYYDNVVKRRVSKKLNRLYGGCVLLPESCDSFLNLSMK